MGEWPDIIVQIAAAGTTLFVLTRAGRLLEYNPRLSPLAGHGRWTEIEPPSQLQSEE